MSAAVDPAWLARLHARLAQPPRQPRLALAVYAQGAPQGVVIGSVEPTLFGALTGLTGPDGAPLLHTRNDGGWLLQGEPTAALACLALALRAAGLCGAWRDEALAVRDAQGTVRASVERGAVRVLGIATHAVHLVGIAHGNDMAQPGRGAWLQQRAWNKPNDPGCWDTLVGGLVSAADDACSALERETWEEAGLRPSDLTARAQGGSFEVRRPSPDGAGAGYMIERIDWSWATLVPGAVPSNQDGEVERFECVRRSELLRRLHAGAFTDEAARILVDALPPLGWADAAPEC